MVQGACIYVLKLLGTGLQEKVQHAHPVAGASVTVPVWTLPQVLLPKHPGGRTPGKRLLKMWQDMGAPLQVWHNTGVWNNA